MTDHFIEKPEYDFLNDMPFRKPIQFDISQTGTSLTTLSIIYSPRIGYMYVLLIWKSLTSRLFFKGYLLTNIDIPTLFKNKAIGNQLLMHGYSWLLQSCPLQRKCFLLNLLHCSIFLRNWIRSPTLTKIQCYVSFIGNACNTKNTCKIIMACSKTFWQVLWSTAF